MTISTNEEGFTLKYNKEYQLHCEDGPAVIHPDGDQAWYRNGVLHREDGPARVYPNGSELWYQNGVLHREGGPAVNWVGSRQEYWVRGEMYAFLNLNEEDSE